jgi:hypothetical protein
MSLCIICPQNSCSNKYYSFNYQINLFINAR